MTTKDFEDGCAAPGEASTHAAPIDLMRVRSAVTFIDTASRLCRPDVVGGPLYRRLVTHVALRMARHHDKKTATEDGGFGR